MLRTTGLVSVALLGAVLIGGCNNAKGPSDVAKDVKSAEQSAAEKTAKAEDKAGDEAAKARAEVHDQQRDAEHVAAVQEENIAETEAAGERKVALAKCEALSGDRQQSCKDQASAEYDRAVAQAKGERAQSDPKH
jgi:hypothetical protein